MCQLYHVSSINHEHLVYAESEREARELFRVEFEEEPIVAVVVGPTAIGIEALQ